MSRRHTSTRISPENAKDECWNFIKCCQRLVRAFNITPDRIQNMDQMPRYFENNGGRTLTTKGSKEVKMKKGTSGHKKFTVTLRVSRSGKIHKPHLLFSGLKNKPAVNPGCDVDVNKTSMWSYELVSQYFRQIHEDSDKTKHYLMTLDSYGAHIKFIELEAQLYPNIHFVLVPANLTSILQPLDVAINRSLQEFFRDCYNDYIQQAISDPDLQTGKGNIKTPTYSVVSDWISEWAVKFDKDKVKNAFGICGIGGFEDFDQDILHDPLKNLIINEMSLQEWNQKHGECLNKDSDDNFYDLQENDFFWPPANDFSLLRSIKFLKQHFTSGFEKFSKEYLEKVLDSIKLNENLSVLLDKSDEISLKSGHMSGTNVELVAIASLEDWEITYTQLDPNQKMISTTIYTVEIPKKKVHLLNFDDYVIAEIPDDLK